MKAKIPEIKIIMSLIYITSGDMRGCLQTIEPLIVSEFWRHTGEYREKLQNNKFNINMKGACFEEIPDV